MQRIDATRLWLTDFDTNVAWSPIVSVHVSQLSRFKEPAKNTIGTSDFVLLGNAQGNSLLMKVTLQRCDPER
jgi:hypothetical protein